MTAAFLTIRIPNLVLIIAGRLPHVAGGSGSSAGVAEAQERVAEAQECERRRIQRALETRLTARLRRDIGFGED